MGVRGNITVFVVNDFFCARQITWTPDFWASLVEFLGTASTRVMLLKVAIVKYDGLGRVWRNGSPWSQDAVAMGPLKRECQSLGLSVNTAPRLCGLL